MRWMKKLLLGIYLYMGVFFGVCLVCWIVTRDEPAALIAGISVGVGVESLAAGFIRIFESKEQHKHEKEMQNEHTEAEIDQPEAVDGCCGDHCRPGSGFRAE